MLRDIKKTFEMASVIALSTGLLLVAYQINQSTEIATAQVRLDYSAGWRNLDETRQSETFAEVLAKSIENPGSLSLSEMIELDAYYIGVVDQILSAQIAWETGVRTAHYEIAAQQAAKIYFGSEFAQAWWRQTKMTWIASTGQSFQAVMDEAISPVKKTGNQDFYTKIQNDLK
jgi:hypothetical protein